MMTYEQDPDVVCWGLQLFDGDPYTNCGYCGSVSQQHNTDCYPGHYLKGYQYNGDSNYAVGNNLIINNLHEELSRLSMIEPIKSFQEGSGNQQTSFCAQDWFPQSLGNFSYVIDGNGNENEEEEEAELGVSGSCSSPGDKSYSGGEWSCPLELTDEYSFDGEVGKRLNQMVPIPHIPKINGEIPSMDEATLDHQRLLDSSTPADGQKIENKLSLPLGRGNAAYYPTPSDPANTGYTEYVYELVEFKVQGDGNCQCSFQFRALSDQFYRTPEHHKFVRQQIVKQLRSCPEIYEGYVPMAYDHYLSKMSKSGEWGDHVTLQAAADSYGMKIFVITSFKDTCYIEILPNVQKSERGVVPYYN
ncbi:hypothetical protein OROGR_022063 [Orobanche gracilis]